MVIGLSRVLLINPKLCLICRLQLFFVKRSNNSSQLRSLITYVHDSIFNYFNNKNIFRPIGNVKFSRNNFIFDVLTWSFTLTLGSFSLFFTLKSKYVLDSKVNIHAYVLLVSVALNKNPTSLLNLLINCLSAGSAPQILSIKDECIFRFSHLLI